ncbi:unnamed protein product, partial [Mesorhabditis spiculigera]
MDGVIIHRSEKQPPKELHHDARGLRDLKNAKKLITLKFLNENLDLTAICDILFFDEFFRARFDETKNEDEAYNLLLDQYHLENSKSNDFIEKHAKQPWYPGRGVWEDFKLKLHFYGYDYSDGFSDRKTYGMLNEENTGAVVNVSKVILGQWIGGIFFAIFGGQQLLIMTTSAPLSIYILVIFNIATTNHWDFWHLYACVGIWCQIFLFLYAVFEASVIMKHSKRSTEELFSLFISTTFVYKAVSAMVRVYNDDACLVNVGPCNTAVALLFAGSVILCWRLATALSDARNLNLFSEAIRETISDYALPIAVVLVATLTQSLFPDVPQASFHASTTPDAHWIEFWRLPPAGHLVAFGLGFPLSILFFMDQLLVTNTVDNKQNNLKKGSSHNWDFVVVAVLNTVLSVFGLPWMHGGLPQSFLHLKALADVRKDSTGREIMHKVRETRVAVLAAHLLMVPFYYLLPHVSKLMPISLFYGLFLFMAISSLTGHEFFERIQLFFTQQSLYPKREYITKVDQRTIHKFTLCQLVQLAILLAVGMTPIAYVRMTFPLVIFMFIPIRNLVLPKIFSRRDLELVDGVH